jgi:hypothetical protein
MVAKPITRPALLAALLLKRCPPKDDSAASFAEAIANNHLEMVVCGRHDGKPVTYARAFELIYGQRLTLKRCG